MPRVKIDYGLVRIAVCVLGVNAFIDIRTRIYKN